MAAKAPALIVAFRAAESALTSPDASTAMAVKAFMPPARVPVVKDQAPLALEVALPIWVVASNISTELLAAAVPVNVMASPDVPPTGEYPFIVGAANVGVAPGSSMIRG